MPFELEEPPLEKARRQRLERRYNELHFRWFNAKASGDIQTALLAAFELNDVFSELYGQDVLDEMLDDIDAEIEAEPANDA